MNNSTRCLYDNSISAFVMELDDIVYSKMDQKYHGLALTTTRDAWRYEISFMHKALLPWKNENGKIIFEYDIPRLGKRIDVVILLRGIIFCLEFKVGEQNVLEADIDQVLDYALDLKNFHKFSEDKLIVPILIPTKYAKYTTLVQSSAYNDNVLNPLIANEPGIIPVLSRVLDIFPNQDPIDDNWIISPYAPTPTIIEAARALYENHSVEDITRHEADQVSTDATISYIMKIIQKSKENREKSICFVTGVPGAGKTLVGLDVAVRQTYQGHNTPMEDEQAVYLSGNGPLVAVLTEALAKDNYEKSKKRGETKKLSDSRREVGKFIHIIHRYRDNMLAKIKNPIENNVLEIDPEKAIKVEKAGYGEIEHVAIFDEAQRAWTHKRLADYLKRGGTYGNKMKIANFPMSEAAFLIWSLDLREDWAVIVCLVGGGQEINTGEAGIGEWIQSINRNFPWWKIYISSKLSEPEYAEGKVNELLRESKDVTFAEQLHLGVSLRSFRAEKLSKFINALLAFKSEAAAIYEDIKDRYPIYLTRNMNTARKWLHAIARGTEKSGILVTKEAARYKPLAVHILPSDVENTVHWFLEDKTDIRSSNYLEDAATEIQVQGLELDYTCLLWDADVRYENGEWHFYRFNGQTKWVEQTGKSENQQEQIQYMLNAYRVLLTRARKGMIICIPAGNANKTPNGFWEDSTRLPEYYNGTYNYLKSLGIIEIE